MIGNHVSSQGLRGFESLPLRSADRSRFSDTSVASRELAHGGRRSYEACVPVPPRPPTGPHERERAETLLAPAGQSAYEPGRVIVGRYRLERRLAVGGMGELWVATNLSLEQRVAIKLLRRNSRSAASAERLVREARTAARVRHRAIVQVFDVGVTEDGEPFLVMELLVGRDLSELARFAGPLDAVQATQLLIPVLSGLAAAHAQGIVHRDLKPENVFLADLDGGRVQPKIVDFGIARVALPIAGPRLTSVGMLIGTPAFMAPEQIECLDDVDGRADLWAFGVTFYSMIAGDVPFTGSDPQALFDAILDAHVSFPTRAQSLDGDLWAIITDCLRRDRKDRWQRAEEVEAALTGWLLARRVTEDASGRTLRVVSPLGQSRTTERERVGPAIAEPQASASPAVPSAPVSSPASNSLDRAIFSSLKKRPT